MTKSATDLMGEIIFSAVLDSMVALKGASGGLPNVLWRDVAALHPNTTLKDLPEPVQKAVAESVRTAFAKLRQEGYAVAPGSAVTPDRRGPPPGGGRPGGSPRPRPARPSGPPTVETRRRPTVKRPPTKKD